MAAASAGGLQRSGSPTTKGDADVWDNTMKAKLGNPSEAKEEDVKRIAGLWQALHLFPKEKENIKVWTTITIGMQSAGKTTIVERYLQKAFSTVSSGTATLRPCITEIYPNEEFSIEVYEEIEGNAGKASEATLASFPDLADWMKEHNKLSEQPLHVQIRDPACKHPRRIVDLPGLKTVDQKGTEGTKDQIQKIVEKWIKKPRTLVLLMQSAEQEPSASKLPEFIEAFRKYENHKDSDGMVLFPILTRCDMLLRKDGEEVDKRLREWAEVCGVLPMMCGWSLPEDVSAPTPDQRQQHYKKANGLEEKGLEDFLGHVRTEKMSEKCRRHLKECCSFSDVEKLLEAHLVAADLKQVDTTVKMLKGQRHDLEQELESLREREKLSDKTLLKDRMKKALHRALRDQQALSSADGGPTFALHHSDDSSCEKYGKTLKEEEEDFQANSRMYGFDCDDDIDYFRVGEMNADGFPKFLKAFVDDELDSAGGEVNIDNKDEKLLPGVDHNLNRQAALLRHLAMKWLVRTDGSPQQLLKNLVGPAYEQLSNEHSIQKGVRFLQVHAARMRPLVQYLMERTCFLMTKVLRMSIDLLQKNPAMKKDMEALGGIEKVREAIERGFCKQLKHHASKNYQRATQNHFECTQDLGRVEEEPFGSADRPEIATDSDRRSKATGSNATAPPQSNGAEGYAELLEFECFEALARTSLGDMEDFPVVKRGIKQSMMILAHSNVHPVEGSKYTCEVFKRLLVETDNEEFKKSLLGKVHAEDGQDCFSDQPCSKRPVGELFGFGATVLGYIMPQFNQKAINAAQCGLWIAPRECYSSFLCDMQVELDEHIDKHDLGASVKEQMEHVKADMAKVDEALRACSSE